MKKNKRIEAEEREMTQRKDRKREEKKEREQMFGERGRERNERCLKPNLKWK